VHGVRWFDRVMRVRLPTRGPAVAATLVLCALLAAAELEMSLMLVPPGPTTLGVRLYTLIHTAPDRVVSSVAILVLLLVLAIGGTAMAGLHLHERRRRS
jgi:iron(III) transport system permease protein